MCLIYYLFIEYISLTIEVSHSWTRIPRYNMSKRMNLIIKVRQGIQVLICTSFFYKTGIPVLNLPKDKTGIPVLIRPQG